MDHRQGGAGAPRRRPIPLTLALLPVLLVLAALGGLRPDVTAAAARPAAPPGAPPGPTGVLPANGHWTVTLVSGEVIDVSADADGRPAAAVRRADGPVLVVRRPDGDVQIIPTSVMPLLGDVLDRELFNVTGLVRQGYDDDARATTPVIVRRPGQQVGAAGRAPAAGPGERALPSIGAVAKPVPKGDRSVIDQAARDASRTPAVRNPGVSPDGAHVWLDRRIHVEAEPAAAPDASTAGAGGDRRLDRNLTQIGADRAWQAGFTGAGVTVAVLDTGIDDTHPDLAGRVAAAQSFTTDNATADAVGHGTHVAGVVAGTGAAAGGARTGVAPGARLLSGRVLDAHGSGTDSWLIAGMEWAAPQAKVVNLSLGSPGPGTGDDPVSAAVDRLTDTYGTLFVVAAGNSGPRSNTIGSPAGAARALTVGAVNGADAVAPFSSRGPVTGTASVKPEVAAPGVDIISARATGTSLDRPVDRLYTRASGTSMATPHVTGAAALLAQQHPDWKAGELKRALVGTARDIKAPVAEVGSGRLDVGRAVGTALRAEDEPVERTLPRPRGAVEETLTWTNTGTEAVTVDLSADLADATQHRYDGVSITPASLTVAPGARASATLRVDAAGLADGRWSGHVRASAAGTTVITPVALLAQPEMTDLTVTATPLPGVTGPPTASALVINRDDFSLLNGRVFLGDPFGDRATVRVPVGRYAVIGAVSSNDRDARQAALAGDLDVAVNGPTTVTLDGAASTPLAPVIEGVTTSAPVASDVTVSVVPRAGTDGQPVSIGVSAGYPLSPVRVSPLDLDEGTSARALFRAQAPHLFARTEGVDTDIELRTISEYGREPEPGEHTLTAFDGGDGSDLAAARDRLAVVVMPEDLTARAEITERARAAGVALLAFVDEQRPFLTPYPVAFGPGGFVAWAELPTVTSGGASATALRQAAAAGRPVTVTYRSTPYVYDLVHGYDGRVVPDPVIDRATQAGLATIDETFHADGTGALHNDRRYAPELSVAPLDAKGPLPAHRTDHVSPDVAWMTVVFGPTAGDANGPQPMTALTMDAGRTFAAGRRYTADWVRRPQHPGPVGGPVGPSLCQPRSSTRSTGTMVVAIAPIQDGPDRFSCGDPMESRLVVERDGMALAPPTDQSSVQIDVPAGRATYTVRYDGRAQAPYAQHSTTVWTFLSAAPPANGQAALPLAVVDYDLPLDPGNRPTKRTATFRLTAATGAPRSAARSMTVQTSTDGGATWTVAPVRRTGTDTFAVTLPTVAAGTAVSLRTDAATITGSRIEQTLFDAYLG